MDKQEEARSLIEVPISLVSSADEAVINFGIGRIEECNLPAEDTDNNGYISNDDGPTNFSDAETEQDNDDIFCEQAEDISKIKKHITRSLHEIFVDESGTSNIDEILDDDDQIPSDELHSDCDSQETNGELRDYPYFNEKTGFGKGIDMAIGLQFVDVVVFRKALREYAIRNGFDYDYINNKKSRVTAQCRNDDCPWRIRASQQINKSGGTCFQIKSIHPHKKNCGKFFQSSKLTSQYLAEHYLENFRDNPKWEIEAFMKHVKREFEVEVTHKKCWRAKSIALTMIEGAVGEQFKLIRDYCAALEQWNSGSSVYLTTDAGHFQRIYICLDACKRGFLAGCRPIISLDACHLKGAYTGQIHAAIGRDGNDNMFPIAYAICEAESKDTWHWFIQNLLTDIGNSRQDGWCFISDQQKGLQEAIKELCPNSAHRFCVRHLYANFRKVFKGKQLKDAMWACARATTAAQFQQAMNYVKELDNAAYTYLSKLDPSCWSRHTFSYFVKSDALCSNISECFNSFIKIARDQPIITCLETIRRLLMKRFYDKRSGIETYNGDICPRIARKLDDNNKVSMHCNVIYGGGPTLEVEHTTHGTFVVNVPSRSCSCRTWDLTGIPCSHACAAIRHIRGNPTDYVHQSYRKLAFMKTYESYIQPIPGPAGWPHQDGETVLPPIFRRQPGRPRRRRIREVNEPVNPNRKRKGGISMTCSRCGSGGHNARRCKGDIVDPKKVEQRKKDAIRAAKNRSKKRQAGMERSSTSIAPDNGMRNDAEKVKKAKVRRNKKVQEPITIRESQVPTSQQPVRDWHSEYDTVGNAVPYQRPVLHGPLQIPSHGGQAMFTRGAALLTYNDTANSLSTAEGRR